MSRSAKTKITKTKTALTGKQELETCNLSDPKHDLYAAYGG